MGDVNIIGHERKFSRYCNVFPSCFELRTVVINVSSPVNITSSETSTFKPQWYLVCTTCIHIQYPCILHTECIYSSREILGIKSDISLKSINQLNFAMESWCVFFKVRAEFLLLFTWTWCLKTLNSCSNNHMLCISAELAVGMCRPTQDKKLQAETHYSTALRVTTYH